MAGTLLVVHVHVRVKLDESELTEIARASL
jgi:hypothetical protein